VEIALHGTRQEFPRGSEWRKWDLQVHTPFSVLNNGFGTDFDLYAKELFERAIANDIHAIGVTDYFSVEGYRALKLLVADGPRLEAVLGPDAAAKARRILLIPNIELRTTPLVTRRDGTSSRVNFHVLFSEELDVDRIDEDFLRVLRFTAEGAPGREDEFHALTRANLEDLGRRLKAEHEPYRRLSDLYVGMENAIIPHEDVTKALETQRSRFEERYLLILPPDEDLSELNWDGQGHLTRKVLFQKSHMFFSANPGTKEFGLGRRHPTVEEFKAEFKSLKPCVHSSDSHDFASMFRPDGGRHTWIKGDLTFRGLRQLLAEPEGRVFIGEEPPGITRIHDRPTRVLQRVSIHKTAGSTLAEEWFDADIDLNPELVAIIGKKGSGKSALADVLGSLGNTPRHDAFSFLSDKHFRHPQKGKASHFDASIEWADGTREGPRLLSQNPAPGSVEKVKYIPQSYLEEICTEISAGSASKFYQELQQAIFSHVPEVERLGCQTLDALLALRGQEIDRAVELTRDELRSLNAQIVALEAQLEPQHREAIEQQLAERQRELAAHVENKPQEIVAPDQDATTVEQSAAALAAMSAAQAEAVAIAAQISALRDEDGLVARREAAAMALVDRMRNLKRVVDKELAEAEPDFVNVGIRVEEVVTFSTDVAPMLAAARAFAQRRSEIAGQRNPAAEGSLGHRQESLTAQIATLESQLSAPQKEYQNYLTALREWDGVLLIIIGSIGTVGTVKFLENQLQALDRVPASLTTLRHRRRRRSREIYRDKQRLRAHYERYFGPVEDFLTNHPLAATADFRLTFKAAIAQEGFSDRFLSCIHQGRIGPFAGVAEGRAALMTMLGRTSWESGRAVVEFAEDLVRSMGSLEGRPVSVAGQLRQGLTTQDLYDLVFGLDYLKPVYELRWDGRAVDELSPGERGDLLLIFYLLIDGNDIPLVLDQPEENLDNQTIVGTLVPCMRDAKKRRQVIMVTHNPNLAVVCDADQVISAEIIRDASCRVVYRSGSIENPATNERIVDILEGTRPAFDQRGARYKG
jgi:ABC-type lipoprotein export system ATPase subunit